MLNCLSGQSKIRAAFGFITAMQLMHIGASSAVPFEEQSYLLVTPKSHPAIDDKLFICDRQGAERAISLNYANHPPLPCEVSYHREDQGEEDISMWQAKYDASFCEKKVNRILTHLKKIGWSCEEF